MAEVTLGEMIACVDRELTFREKLFPRWIDQKKLTQKAANIEMDRMRAVRSRILHSAAVETAYAALAGECGLDAAEQLAAVDAAAQVLQQQYPRPS